MTNPNPLTEQEKADLVALLDGELTGEPARALEAKLSLDPAARAEAEALKRTWDLLDFLPKAEPTPSFTHRTLEKLTPIGPAQPPAAPRRLKRWFVGAGWARRAAGGRRGRFRGRRLDGGLDGAGPREPRSGSGARTCASSRTSVFTTMWTILNS